MNQEAYFQRAQSLIPGGVNSPVRSFGAVGGTPICVTDAEGARLRTLDGQTLTDYCMSWGPLIFGHADPGVVRAVHRAAERGLSFGCNHPGEAELAEMVVSTTAGAEKMRLVNSGTEAVMTALRLARGVTGRTKIVKFDGCYHGHSDSLLVGARSGVLTGGLSASDGVPQSLVQDVYVLPYNDPGAVEAVFAAHGTDIAAVILEPVAGNMGLIRPKPGYLDALRRICSAHGSLLVFDEVITGFRFCPGPYSSLVGIQPDLTVFGKIIGGGMPIGAVVGPGRIMDHLAPVGAVYQAGTLSGNPVAVAAGLATVGRILAEGGSLYSRLRDMGRSIAVGLNDLAVKYPVPVCVSELGGSFTVFFRDEAPTNLEEARSSDTSAHRAFFHGMLSRNIYLPPSPYETAMLSTAHTEGDIDRLLEAAREVLDEMSS